MSSGVVMHSWLSSVMEDGLAIVEGGPAHVDTLRSIAHAIGIIDSSHYG